MKIVLINTHDKGGGAALAANRLHQGLKSAGADIFRIVQNKSSCDAGVISTSPFHGGRYGRVRQIIDNLALRAYPKRERAPFSVSWLPDHKIKLINKLMPDVINLHWITGAMFRIESLASFCQPVVWSLHDSWPFTGGCHLPENSNCDRYTQSCGDCPVLHSQTAGDLSRRVWQRKQAAYHKLRLSIVAPSEWLAIQARRSSLFEGKHIEVIPNALDVQIFKKQDKSFARKILGLPDDKKIVLFPVFDSKMEQYYKGQDLLFKSLQELVQGFSVADLPYFVFFGSNTIDFDPQIGTRCINMGRVVEEKKMAALYAAADVFLLGSRTESMSYLVAEAMACGTPCVAYQVGGIPDLIESNVNGILIRPFSTSEFAREATRLIKDSERLSSYSLAAHLKISAQLDADKIAKRYMELYHSICHESAK